MSYEVMVVDEFKKDVKKLLKKYRSIPFYFLTPFIFYKKKTKICYNCVNKTYGGTP